MCKKKQFKYCPSEIDECMKNIIEFISDSSNLVEPVACCCGHGRYPMTILLKDKKDNLGLVYDLISGVEIPRKKKFYKRDEEGYYFIPETI